MVIRTFKSLITELFSLFKRIFVTHSPSQVNLELSAWLGSPLFRTAFARLVSAWHFSKAAVEIALKEAPESHRAIRLVELASSIVKKFAEILGQLLLFT